MLRLVSRYDSSPLISSHWYLVRSAALLSPDTSAINEAANQRIREYKLPAVTSNLGDCKDKNKKTKHSSDLHCVRIKRGLSVDPLSSLPLWCNQDVENHVTKVTNGPQVVVFYEVLF